jgi:hypothetical protein
MPAYLAAAASRNLALQDSAIAKVNAASRVVAANGGGAPDMAIASAMDNADLSTRIVQGPWAQPGAAPPNGIDIAAVHDRRNKILQGIDPDAPALFVDDKRRRELHQELGILTGVAHEHALEAAAQAHQDFIKQRDINVANQSKNIFDGLKDINPDGSPKSEAAVRDLIANNRTAFDVSPAVKEEVKRHAKIHDKAAAALETPDSPVVDAATGLAWNGSRWVTPPIIAGGAQPAQKIPASAYTDLGRLNAQKAGDLLYLDKEVDPNKKVLLQKKIDATQSAIDSWHETYSPKTTAAAEPGIDAESTAAPVAPSKRFVFNPATKKLEPAK